MNYEEFKKEQDEKLNKKRQEAIDRGNIAYNRGLIKGLGFFGMYLYPLLKK